jgi:hypothetical protein
LSNQGVDVLILRAYLGLGRGRTSEDGSHYAATPTQQSTVALYVKAGIELRRRGYKRKPAELIQYPKINALLQNHASQDGFQVDWVLLVSECVMPQKVDVLPSDGRNPH